MIYFSPPLIFRDYRDEPTSQGTVIFKAYNTNGALFHAHQYRQRHRRGNWLFAKMLGQKSSSAGLRKKHSSGIGLYAPKAKKFPSLMPCLPQVAELLEIISLQFSRRRKRQLPAPEFGKALIGQAELPKWWMKFGWK